MQSTHAQSSLHSSASSPKPPQKPKLTLRVGVSGHLEIPPGETVRIQAQVRKVLQQIREIAKKVHAKRCSSLKIYADDELVLRIISPLAEGADRLVAKIGGEEGFKLRCPLPFPQKIYEQDFKLKRDHPFDTTDEFRSLLAQANGEILELDGTAGDDEAYEAVGRVVLRNCDILITLWDEKHAGGKEKTGGTRQVIRESLGLEIPTVWISAKEDREPCVLLSIDPERTESLDCLEARITNMLIFAPGPDVEGAQDGEEKKAAKRRKEQIIAAEEFFREILPNRDTFLFEDSSPYTNFRDFWCWTWAEPPAPQNHPEPGWRILFEKNGEFAKQIEENYLWSNRLAEYYGALFRSSFVLAYLMGAYIILASFLGFYLSSHKSDYEWDLFFVTEFLLIVIVSSLTWIGRKQKWHQRWMDYRLLAESLRHLEFLAPLGRITLSVKVPAHLQPSDPRNSWVNWYFRAIVREGGMINANFDQPYLRSCLDILRGSIQYQIDYHEGNSVKLKVLAHRTRLVAHGFFAIAGLACILHLIGLSYDAYHDFIDLFLNFCTIVLPAFGAALTAISHHGDFERLEMRSGALAERLTHLLKVELPSGDTLSSKELGRAAEVFSEVMFGEALDWRFAFLDKNLELPS